MSKGIRRNAKAQKAHARGEVPNTRAHRAPRRHKPHPRAILQQQRDKAGG